MSTEKNNVDQNIPTWTNVHQKVLNDILQHYPRTGNEFDYKFLMTICAKWRSSFSGKSAITDDILMKKIYASFPDQIKSSSRQNSQNSAYASWTMAHQKFLNESLEEYLRRDIDFDPSFVTKLFENLKKNFASITEDCLFQRIQETINRLN